MATPKSELTQARLKELLHYDPETGVFTWLVSRGGTARAGSRAGSLNNRGYTMIKIDGVDRSAHRLAFLYVKGEIPSEVDHRNRVKDDNSWSNLRPASHPENMGNVGLTSSNSSGFRGVSWHGLSGKWQAYGARDGRRVHLKLFDNLEEAAAAAKKFRRERWGEFAPQD